MKRLLKFGMIAAGGFLALMIAVAVFSDPEPEGTETPPGTSTPLGEGTTEIALEGQSGPTPTLEPTPESTPTPTPPPTPNPEPTETPTPEPTPTPEAIEPIVYIGFGDDVISIEKPGQAQAVLMYVRANEEERHFAITSYDSSGDQVGLLVNTTDSYEGIVPLDFMDRENSAQLQVEGTGEWRIELRPLITARAVEVPGSISGMGDDVIHFEGISDTATITGNQEEQHFAVHAYGERRSLLVNTTDVYDGRVIVPSGTVLLAISAVGEWEITFE